MSINNNRGRGIGRWPFRARYRKVQQSEDESSPESVPTQENTLAVPPQTTDHILHSHTHKVLADHADIKAATRAALETLEQTLSEDYLHQTLTTTSVVPHADPQTTVLSHMHANSILPEPSHNALPSLPSSPICKVWQQSYKHIRSLLMSTEGPLELVEHIETGKQFVIKTIAGIPKGHMTREAAMLSCELEPHANLVRLEECFWENNEYHMVIEYCSGGDLQNLCNFCGNKGQRLPAEFVLHFVAETIEAIGYIHNGDTEFQTPCAEHPVGAFKHVVGHETVLHRDIKPGNVFLRWEEAKNDYGMPQIVLGDFGRSCLESDNEDAHGTQGFAAPEIEEAWYSFSQDDSLNPHQAFNSKASDVYSFGATLYYLITYKPYHDGDDIEAAWRMSALNDCTFIGNILWLCLSKDPADRPTMEELYEVAGVVRLRLQKWYREGGRVAGTYWPNPRWTQELVEADEQDRVDVGPCPKHSADGSCSCLEETTDDPSTHSPIGTLTQGESTNPSSDTSFESDIAFFSDDDPNGPVYQFNIMDLFARGLTGDMMHETDDCTPSTSCFQLEASACSSATEDSFVY